MGSKAIKIEGNGTRLDADVVVCNSYRRYLPNHGSRKIEYIEGILFEDGSTGQKVINYPKVHYENGTNKNQNARTLGNYKKVARIFRNIKARLVNDGKITSDLAPSYFVECLIYNGPDIHFQETTFRARVVLLLTQFLTDLHSNNIDHYLVQNEQRKLFGPGDQQWDVNSAKLFVSAAADLINS